MRMSKCLIPVSDAEMFLLLLCFINKGSLFVLMLYSGSVLTGLENTVMSLLGTVTLHFRPQLRPLISSQSYKRWTGNSCTISVRIKIMFCIFVSLRTETLRTPTATAWRGSLKLTTKALRQFSSMDQPTLLLLLTTLRGKNAYSYHCEHHCAHQKSLYDIFLSRT